MSQFWQQQKNAFSPWQEYVDLVSDGVDGGVGCVTGEVQQEGEGGCHGCNSPLPIHSTHTITLSCQRREHAKTMMLIVLTTNIKLVSINYVLGLMQTM